MDNLYLLHVVDYMCYVYFCSIINYNSHPHLLPPPSCPECLTPYPLRVTGDDEKSDMVVALLCVGLYPNVCFHKEKRLLITSEGKKALIHKTSVNNITKDPRFPSPYFVFGEKVLSHS